MAYTHIGHNQNLVMDITSNSVQVAGHVKVEDKAIIGGCLGIHCLYILTFSNDRRNDKSRYRCPSFCLAEGHP